MDIVLIIVAGLIYPGLATALAAGMLYRRLLGGGAFELRPNPAWRSREGVASIVGIAAAGVGLALLPWPFHPVGANQAWLWAWAGIELAFLLPLTPALASGVPKVARAAMRRAQIGVFGRMLLWVALTTALIIQSDWRIVALPAHLLAITAALVAFPLAVGWGPFDDEVSITGVGIHAGLTPELRQLEEMGRDIAAGTLLAAIMLTTLPTAIGPTLIVPIMVVAGFVVVGIGLRRMAGELPRLSLAATLRFGWAYIAPLAGAAAVALIIAGQVGG